MAGFVRIKPFASVRNFRDLGGYAAQGGRRVKTGRLYRSGHFSALSAEDRTALDALDIGLVLDLRRSNERAREPSLWPESPVTLLTGDDAGSDAEPPHIAFLRQTDLTVDAVDAFVRGTYRNLPYLDRHVALYGDFLRGLDALPDDQAALVHCAFGKDRTGILCGVILSMLGVSDADVLDDYELTNLAVDLEAGLPREHAKLSKMLGFSPPIEALTPMLGVARPYMETALAEIRARDGSVDGYLDRLGVDAAMRGRLRARLLEPAA